MTPLSRAHTPECCRIEHSETVEDYLKAVYNMTARGELTTTTTIAARLGVSAPSVSTMLGRLSSGGLVRRSGRGRVTLTEHGERHARRVVRRHRLIETFLARVLDVPWDELHAEAEVLEHAISSNLEERIDAWLGQPDRDPHGDPIPPRMGDYSDTWPQALHNAPAGCQMRVERVSDRDSAALRYLGELGIRPGTTLVVEQWAPFGGPLWVSVQGTRVALGDELTHLVHGVIERPASATPSVGPTEAAG